MASIPIVGAGQTHQVQLSPALRKLLHHRAAAAARREAAPVLAADREVLRIPQQEYRTAATSNKAALDAVVSSLAGALASLGGSGLKGHYRQETAQGLRDQKAQALAALPYLNAIAGEERAKGMTEARTQLVQDRAAMQQNAAQGFNSLLEKARGAGTQSEKEREGRERSNRQEVKSNEREHAAEVKENHREHAVKQSEAQVVPETVQSNYEVALSGYKYLLAHTGQETQKGNTIEAPKSVPEWEEFTHQVAKEGSGDYKDALEAVEMLRKQLARLRHAGKLPEAGSESEQE